MNTQNHDDLEQMLGRELRGRVDGMNDAPLGFADVRGRAGRIQRNRRIAVGTGIAAAVAVIVPTAVMAGSGLGGPDRDIPPATQTAEPSPSPTPAPTPRADGSFRLTIEGLDRGEPAGIVYTVIDQQRLMTPGQAFDTPEAYRQITRYGDGWLALRAGEFPPNGTQVAELTEGFEVVSSVTSGPSMVVSQDETQVAWVEIDDGQSVLVTGSTDGSEPQRTTVSEEPANPEGFLPGGEVVFSTRSPDTGEQSFAALAPNGEVSDLGGDFLNVYDASQANGLVAGQTDYRTDGTSCSGVLDPAGSEMLWDTCEHTLGRFSPDGGYVVSFANQYDGPGSPTVGVLEAGTGEPVVEFTPDRNVFTGVDQVEWEDRDTLIATVTQGQDQALLRLELNGSIELVDGPFRTGGMDVNLWLAEHPWD